MELWKAAVLGIIQGLTEFLPISSTAHVRIFEAFLGEGDSGAAFTAVIQLGTLLAVLVYFARDLFVDMPRAMFKDRSSPAGRLPWLLALGTIPIAIAGVGFKDYITGDLRSLYVIAGALIAVAIVFIVAERVGTRDRAMAAITAVDVIIIGLAQTCALVPGVSRSGATIAAALFLGLRRSDAARFSFLLSVPAIAGAGIFELQEALDQLGPGAWLPLLIGSTTAALTGYAAIAWLLRFLERRSLLPFAVYRIALGVVIVSLCVGAVLGPGS